jgi:hypothetical protein
MFTMCSEAMMISPATKMKKVVEDFIILYVILLSVIIISYP